MNLSGSECCGVVTSCDQQREFFGTSVGGQLISGRPTFGFTTANCRECQQYDVCKVIA
jgi:hypothetical protein